MVAGVTFLSLSLTEPNWSEPNQPTDCDWLWLRLWAACQSEESRELVVVVAWENDDVQQSIGYISRGGGGGQEENKIHCICRCCLADWLASFVTTLQRCVLFSMMVSNTKRNSRCKVHIRVEERKIISAMKGNNYISKDNFLGSITVPTLMVMNKRVLITLSALHPCVQRSI